MASFSSLSLRSASSDPRLSFAAPRRSSVSLPAGAAKRRVSFSPGKAMAVVKFKGTRMRDQHLSEMIEKKVLEAKEVCEGKNESDECKVAWDEVEEVSQAKADLRRKLEKEDPLESFCSENPETEECRIDED
ncbi:calvin cycle protein CP12-3, chloroplastic-like [Aristolochia californica]|uniref:calvin cycle protein CP12-3, chloroplastic-like n=1 Tax=Aristolochia californica TaxID=171875 RepID=UPI0035DA27FF